MNKILIEYIENVFHHLYNELLNNKKNYRRISNIIKKYFLILYRNPSGINHLNTISVYYNHDTYGFVDNKIQIGIQSARYLSRSKVDSFYLFGTCCCCRFCVKTKYNDYYIAVLINYEEDI